MAKPLPYRDRDVLRKYAQSLDDKQNELAELFGVHYVTMSRWLNGHPCGQYEECTDLARRVLAAHPEWGDTDTAKLIAQAKATFGCDLAKAKVIASVIAS